MEISVIIVVVIVTALAFDFTNGFHDTANAVATSIATGALKPRTAVLIAGVLNLVGAFLSVQVAKTISSGLVDDTKITPTVIFAGLVGGDRVEPADLAGGAALQLLARVDRRPDRRHLGGRGRGRGQVRGPGRQGAAARGAGADHRRAHRADRDPPRLPDHRARRAAARSRRASSSARSSPRRWSRSPTAPTTRQKTMGIITLTLITAGALPADAGPPFWVILSSGLAIALGTYMGGWRIIQTLGMRVSAIETPQGFAAGTSTATVILTSSHLGFPLSTTQVATGSIFGAGAARGAATVRWGIGGQVAFAWLLTLPAAAAFGAVAAWMADTGPVGTIIVALVLVGVAGGIYAASRRRPVTADNVNDLPAPSPQVDLAA